MSDQVLLDGPALTRVFKLGPTTIRNWAHQGRLQRLGTDARGRALYDFDQVEALINEAATRPRGGRCGRRRQRPGTVQRGSSSVPGARQ